MATRIPEAVEKYCLSRGALNILPKGDATYMIQSGISRTTFRFAGVPWETSRANAWDGPADESWFRGLDFCAYHTEFNAAELAMVRQLLDTTHFDTVYIDGTDIMLVGPFGAAVVPFACPLLKARLRGTWIKLSLPFVYVMAAMASVCGLRVYVGVENETTLLISAEVEGIVAQYECPLYTAPFFDFGQVYRAVANVTIMRRVKAGSLRIAAGRAVTKTVAIEAARFGKHAAVPMISLELGMVIQVSALPRQHSGQTDGMVPDRFDNPEHQFAWRALQGPMLKAAAAAFGTREIQIGTGEDSGSAVVLRAGGVRVVLLTRGG